MTRITLTERLRAFVDYEERATQQAIADLRRLLADLETLEHDHEQLTAAVSILLLRVRELGAAAVTYLAVAVVCYAAGVPGELAFALAFFLYMVWDD